MIPHSAPSTAAPSATNCVARASSAEMTTARLAIVTELETSLRASQQALLTRDLDGIEQGMREQKRLERAFAILQPEPISNSHDRTLLPAAASCDPKLAGELRAAATRVLHLGRVQAALLRRARQSLTVLSNLLAGPEAGYGPPQRGWTQPTAPLPGSGRREPNQPPTQSLEEPPCRA